MNTLKNLSNRFGINQKQLAHFLSVGKSMISQVNSGLKPMPAKYMIQLQKLLTLDTGNNHAGKIKIRTLSNPVPAPGTTAQIQTIIVNLEIKLKMLQKQLRELQQQWKECIKTASFCAMFETETLSLTAKQHRWLEELKYRNEQKQLKCTPDKHLLISLQVQSIKAQLFIYKRAAPIKQQINSAPLDFG